MCGILVSLALEHSSSKCIPAWLHSVKNRIKRRGPDHSGQYSLTLKSGGVLHIFASVLHMRGSLFMQPHVSRRYVFTFNGEIFNGLPDLEKNNDAGQFFSQIIKLKGLVGIANFLQNLQGPFCFVLVDLVKSVLYFAKDVLGKRSLVLSLSKGSLLLSSVAVTGEFEFQDELPPGVLFAYDLITRHIDVVPLRPYIDNLNVLCGRISPKFSVNYMFAKQTVCYFQLKSYWHGRKCELLATNPDNIDTWISKLGVELESFWRHLLDAVKMRVQNNRYRVAILFSGGVDSLLLAALLHASLDHFDVLDPIDLINVAFMKKASNCANSAPDRITGLDAWTDLQRIYPQRVWNFVHVNVGADDAAEVKNVRLGQLLAPGGSVLDESLGLALWFAAKGDGVLMSRDGKSTPYSSPAKILLSGIGPDELLGGYSRHRTRFNRGGWDAVRVELEMELCRIGNRNFARDDRIVADHGKELRLPYFDENVVSFLNQLPINVKMDLNQPRGVGEKLLLRLLLYKQGFHRAAFVAKRAMQFGSNSAKVFF